jgi:hypothetical protein
VGATRPAVVALICLLGMASLAWSAGGGATSAEVVHVRPDPPGSPRTLAPLTPRQRRQAKRIIARDSRLRQIVDPHAYRLGKLVPWGVEDKRKRQPREVFIGTVSEAVLTMPKPSVVATWPVLSYPKRKRPAYRVQLVHLTVRGLRSVSLYVDLKRRRLAGIAPASADEVIPPPGYQPPPSNPH